MDPDRWRAIFGVVRAAAAWCLLLVVAVFLALPAAGMLLGMVPSPVVPDPGVRPQRVDGRLVLGASYLERVGAIHHLHLEGDEIAIGYAHGALVGDRIALMEGELLATFTELVPSFWLRHLVLGLVAFNNRGLAAHFRATELRELAAMGHAHGPYSDRYRGLSPGFTRAVQYHALHDASQYMIDNPLVNAPQVGCTAVAAWGPRSRTGHIVVGRLFDFEGGDHFDTGKLVITCRPDRGLAFCSVVWPGMLGAVTGLNEAGLWISINASLSDGRRFAGRPIVLVVREMLQHAETIDEAVAILTAAELFVSSAVVIASGDEKRVVVVEVGPEAAVVREPEGRSLAVTNHFRHPDWAGDEATRRRLEEGTSPRRLARAEALLAAVGRHDPASLLAILRDRRGPDGLDVGFGNRGTINAWIGAHLVVADPAARRLYVCEPHHGLGRAVAFGIDGPLDLPPLPAARAELAWHEAAATAFEADLDQARDLLARGERIAAAALARDLLERNPRSFAAHEIAGRAKPDAAERRWHLEHALDLYPAYPADEERIRAALRAERATSPGR